jgi:hypothetical protein
MQFATQQCQFKTIYAAYILPRKGDGNVLHRSHTTKRHYRRVSKQSCMSSGSFGYHGNVLFNRTSEGSQSTEIGDSLSYNTAVTWRLNNHNLTLHDHNHGEFEHSETQWDLMLEMNGVSMRKTRVATISQRSSGGTTLFLSPGLKVTLGKFNAFATFSIPLIQNKNGNQENIEKRMIAGVSFAL